MGKINTLSIEIDLNALASNLSAARKLCRPDQIFIASVKGNAYGHGVVEVATKLQSLGVEMLATGNINEARALRENDISIPILLFAFGSIPQTIAAIEEGFIPTLTNVETAKAISDHFERTANVYLKVDAGLGRLGIPIEQAENQIKKIAGLDKIHIGGIYTHIPFGDSLGYDWAMGKSKLFQKLLSNLSDNGIEPEVTQAVASSCLLAGVEDSCNAVCVGHAMYGLSPYGYDGVADMSALKPMLKELKTQLIHLSKHQVGSDIALVGKYDIKDEMILGVLPIGVSHGMRPVVEGQELSVLINRQLANVVSVNLEHTTIDLSGHSDCAIGDTVYLVSTSGDRKLGLDDLARSWSIPPLEAIQSLSSKMT